VGVRRHLLLVGERQLGERDRRARRHPDAGKWLSEVGTAQALLGEAGRETLLKREDIRGEARREGDAR
jgi:hypothetical protein